MTLKKVKWNERLACMALGKLKYNNDDAFYPCRYNDTILTISKLLLFGRDPIQFMIDLLDLDAEDIRQSAFMDL